MIFIRISRNDLRIIFVMDQFLIQLMNAFIDGMLEMIFVL